MRGLYILASPGPPLEIHERKGEKEELEEGVSGPRPLPQNLWQIAATGCNGSK